MLKGKRDSLGLLKSGVNEADTGSVVNSVRGFVAFGKQKMSGNVPSRNSMVSGNTGLKRKK
jgi:hypothetical protein